MGMHMPIKSLLRMENFMDGFPFDARIIICFLPVELYFTEFKKTSVSRIFCGICGVTCRGMIDYRGFWWFVDEECESLDIAFAAPARTTSVLSFLPETANPTPLAHTPHTFLPSITALLVYFQKRLIYDIQILFGMSGFLVYFSRKLWNYFDCFFTCR